MRGFVSELQLSIPTLRLSEEQRQEVVVYILSWKKPAQN